MLSQTVKHPIIMYIAAAILISKTCSLYLINGNYETQESINTVYKIILRNWIKNLPLIQVPRGHIFGDYQG
jgi:hypothetical protein